MQAGTPGPLEEFTPFVRCSIIDPMAEDDKKAIIFNALAVDVFKQLGELIDCVHDEYPYELYVAPVNDVVEQFRRSSRVVYDWIIQHYGSCEDFLESQLDKVFTGRGPRMRMNALRYTVITHQEYSSDRRLPKLTKTLSRQDLLLVLYQKDYFYWITNKFNKNRIKRTPVVRSNGSTSATNSTHNTAGATTGQNAVQPMYDRLTTEIMNFYTTLQPHPNAIKQRKLVIEKINRMLKDRWPYENLRVKPFGSSASGLDSDKSDLDLCITVPLHQFTDDIYNKWNLDRMPNSYYNMHRVAQSLRQIGMRNVVPVPTAKVPICKFTDPQFNIECDINTNNTLGIINSRLIKCYTQLDHRVKPFLYVIKHFVKTREINNPTMGTLSSYAYVLIALYYLMTCNPPVIPNLQTLANCSHPSCSSNKLDTCLALNKRRPTYYDVVYHDSVKLVHRTHPAYSMSTATNPSKYCTVWEGYNSDSVGQLLVSFFQWFVNLNHKACAMSFKLGCMISRKTYHWGGHCIAIQDPFIMERNVAVSCSGFGYKHIIEEFSRATDALLQNHPLQSVFAPAIVYSYQDNMEAILESPQHRIMRQKQINEMEKALRRLNKSIAANAAANASNVRATVQIESVRTATPPSHQVPSGGRQNSTAASSGQQQQRRNGGRTSNQKRSSYERDKEMFEKALAVSDEDYYDDDDDWDDMPLTYHDWVQGLAPAPPRGNVSMRDLFGPEYYNDEDYDEEEDDLPNRPYSGDDISDDVLQTALLFSLLSTNPSQPNIDHELVDRIEAVLPALSAAAARNMAQDSRSGAAPATAHEVPDSYWKDDTPSICTLLDVPSYIDELQVIDALSEYGQVLDVVQFDSVDHFVVGLISWEIMIMLHDDVDDLPQYIDFGGGLRIPVE